MSLLDRTASILGRGRLLPCTCFFHGLLVRRERVQVLCVADLLHGFVLPSIDEDVEALHVGVHSVEGDTVAPEPFKDLLRDRRVDLGNPLRKMRMVQRRALACITMSLGMEFVNAHWIFFNFGRLDACFKIEHARS